jgi:hypothetical protein
MPFAKVGAMPQPSTTATHASPKLSSNKNSGRNGGSSKQRRPKGITMEVSRTTTVSIGKDPTTTLFRW